MLNLLIATFACLASLASTAKAVAVQANPLFPNGWRDVRVVSNSSVSTVSNYLLINSYAESCSSEPTTVTAIGFGACIVGYDICGKPVGTPTKYTYTKQAGGSLYYTMETFSGADCNSSPTVSYPLVLPLGCSLSTAGAYGYGYAEGAQSWKGVNSGVVTLTHYSSDCSQNPAMWTSLSYNYCFQTGSTCEHPTALQMAKYSKCSGDVASIAYYSDATCQTASGSGDTLPATTCQPSNGAIWASLTCN